MEKLKAVMMYLWENKILALKIGLFIFVLYFLSFIWCGKKKQIENIKTEVVNTNGAKVQLPTMRPETVLESELKKKEEIYVPPEGSITITPKDKNKSLVDVVEIKEKWYGWTFEPGLQVGVVTPSFGLDAKIAYMNRLGLVVGLSQGLGNKLDLSPVAGVSYRLDKVTNDWLRNTEAIAEWRPIGIIPFELGLRINF